MPVRLGLLFALLIFIYSPSLGQEAALIKIADGLLWVENSENIHFILEIKGADVRPMQQHPFLSVDGRPMQILMVEPITE